MMAEPKNMKRIPLQQWMKVEAKKQLSQRPDDDDMRSKRELLVCKTTVAYGIAQLLKRAMSLPGGASPPSCTIDNFAVRTNTAAAQASESDPTSPKDIVGVDMISPPLSCDIFEPSFLFDDHDSREGCAGRYLEVDFPSYEDGADNPLRAVICQSEEEQLLHSLGVLVHDIYTNLPPLLAGGADWATVSSREATPPMQDHTVRDAYPTALQPNSLYIPLVDLGFPSSICMLVKNLLECASDGDESRENAYESLDAVINDLHLLLLDPDRFLFDQDTTSQAAQLLFREDKLYGREDEVSSITDAFCRVSSGKSEAFVVGGYSGSGKSMLVNSLMARVEVSGGYAVAHKSNQIPKERPLLELISIFDCLCLLIKERRSQEDLLALAKNLAETFGGDISVLEKLLPNVRVLCADMCESSGLPFVPGAKRRRRDREGSSSDYLQSICFTLQRFMRVVSSTAHPVMIFLDDLQWCDASALALVDCILSDSVGSSCLLFVGCYRSNEVKEDHDIFAFTESLKASGVPVTTLSLEGLNSQDLNQMISDALCIFPRICQTLSDIVYQKTGGNPFFALAFVRSLVDEGSLEYSAQKRRWIWDVDRISSMDITGNVLHILSSKMSRLSVMVQIALKVAACFGVKVKDSVVEYLSTTSEYAAIRDGLVQAVKEGFMTNVTTSEWKFCHDKVREAAYSLIPDSEKNQFHYSLGMALYMATRGKDLTEIIFSIVDQINYGVSSSTTQSLALWLDFAKLYELAGKTAVDSSDFATACSYLSTAQSLLPEDQWKVQYSLSLSVSFLLAESVYACGNVLKPKDILQEIIRECHCVDDKLPAYFLLVQILHACGDLVEAYDTCRDVLMQIGEDIPQSVTPMQTIETISMTSEMTKGITDASLLEMKESNKELSNILRFLGLLTRVSYTLKPAMLPFLACRAVQLTMNNGLCKYSITSFVQFAAVLCSNGTANGIKDACRIGKAAMLCFTKRFYAVDQAPRLYLAYCGFVAFYTEPLQSCADMLWQGFQTGVSLGDSNAAFGNSNAHINILFLAGENLPALIQRVDYYLELSDTYKNNVSKAYLLSFRDTISVLMDKGESTSSKPLTEYANSSKVMYFYRAIQAFWLGHSERCHHLIGKAQQSEVTAGGPANIMIPFINGLNVFHVLKRQSNMKLRAIPGNAVDTLKTVAKHSRWNFRNKVHLLEAEICSFQGKHEEAMEAYAASITSARSSRFVHEQGLACELAGHHNKKVGNYATARSFFTQAKECYMEWGSQMKVDSIDRVLGTIPT